MAPITSTLMALLRDPVPYHGALGLFATITIERLNALVGLLVGVATLVYLCLRIRNEWQTRKCKSSHLDQGHSPPS